MGHVQDELKKIIAGAAGVDPSLVKLEHPEVEEFGDYSTNIALTLKGGRLLAEEIVSKIKKDDLVGEASVAGPGFINIKLNPQVFIDTLIDTNIPKDGIGKTVIVDYSAPNIAKAFGIGHLRSTIIGQTIINYYKLLGYKTIGDNHLGDWGTQFGKLLYMIDKYGQGQEFDLKQLESWYVEFHKQAESNKELEEEARRWFVKLEDGDDLAREMWKRCVQVSMTEFDKIYQMLGVKIDYAYGESFYEGMMKTVIQEAKDAGVARESEGAWVIDIEGFETPLMLVKSDGGTTYATRDLATLKFRRDTWNPDIVVYEVGAEQELHFRQVFAAALKLGYVKPETKLVHTKHGLYLGTDGKKFRTRGGNTVKLMEVLEEAIERAKELGCADEVTAQKVGIGAIKYFDLLHNIQSNIVFDWDKVMALDGNSGPYLQYTYARTRSVLNKSERVEEYKSISNYKYNTEEMAILRWIYRYPEVIEEAAERLASNLVCNFLYELAQRFNTFYNKHTILGNDDTREFRLALTAGVGQVIKNGLEVLGIEAVEKM
jgi:arginyl-tRNA synthetase